VRWYESAAGADSGAEVQIMHEPLITLQYSAAYLVDADLFFAE